MPCVCSVIDDRWRQNGQKDKKVVHTRLSRVCHWCSYHILTSSVIYYWTGARQLGIYLFYVIKNYKKVLLMTSSIRLSSNRSWVRTNQNACITELIIYTKIERISQLCIFNTKNNYGNEKPCADYLVIYEWWRYKAIY